MKVEFSWRDPKARYRWKFQEMDLAMVPRVGESVSIGDIYDEVTSVDWKLTGEEPLVEIVVGEDPLATQNCQTCSP